MPAAMAVTPVVRPETWVTENLGVVVPSPSCPELLLPQHFAEPETTAHANSKPTLTAVATGLHDDGPVKAPVVVLNDTPAGSVPLYEYEVGDPAVVTERTCDADVEEKVLEAYEIGGTTGAVDPAAYAPPAGGPDVALSASHDVTEHAAAHTRTAEV